MSSTLPYILPVVGFSRGSAPKPFPRDVVFPGLPTGKAAILSALGGTGKSFFSLSLECLSPQENN